MVCGRVNLGVITVADDGQRRPLGLLGAQGSHHRQVDAKPPTTAKIRKIRNLPSIPVIRILPSPQMLHSPTCDDRCPKSRFQDSGNRLADLRFMVFPAASNCTTDGTPTASE